MRRLLVFLTILVVMSFPYYTPVKAADSVNGVLKLDLNITVVNTAPFPKFLVLNPSYKIKVYRSANNTTTLNGNLGIWLMPYETVVINFVSVQDESYFLPKIPCGESNDGSKLACGFVAPPLINSPYSLSARSMFPVLDGYIKIIGYNGRVTFNLTPGDSSPTFFAVTLPVLFPDGKITNFKPNYTMTYKEYANMLYNYTDIKWKRKIRENISVPNPSSGLFQLTPRLIAGVQITKPTVKIKDRRDLDIPVWIIYSTGGSVEISYNVKWSAGGG